MDLGRQDRRLHGRARDDDARAHHRVQRVARAAVVGEDELGRRQRLRQREDRPLHVVEVEHRVDGDEVHVRVVERVERPHVAPVAAVALGGAGDLVGGEVVDVRGAGLDEHRDDVAAHVVRGVARLGVERDDVDQRVGGEHVVAHRRVDLVGRVAQPDGVLGLLAEGGDRLAVGRGLDDPELVGLLDRHPERRDRHRGAGLDVLADHLLGVHAVDVVGAEHDDDVGPLVAQQVEVLVDRVGRALEPVRAAAHLRGHRRHVVAQQRRQAPGGGDVAVQRVALVLREHDDPPVAGVDQVRQREVDQPVVAAERDRRLGAVERQRRQPLALAPRQDDREHVVLVGGLHPARLLLCGVSKPLAQFSMNRPARGGFLVAARLGSCCVWWSAPGGRRSPPPASGDDCPRTFLDHLLHHLES